MKRNFSETWTEILYSSYKNMHLIFVRYIHIRNKDWNITKLTLYPTWNLRLKQIAHSLNQLCLPLQSQQIWLNHVLSRQFKLFSQSKMCYSLESYMKRISLLACTRCTQCLRIYIYCILSTKMIANIIGKESWLNRERQCLDHPQKYMLTSCLSRSFSYFLLFKC